MRFLLALALLMAGAMYALAGPAVVTADIPYGDLERQKLDLYAPAEPADDAPGLVFFYGGGWERGAKEDIRAMAESLVAAGMIVVVPDYRLYPQVVFPQFVEDCALAVERARQMVSQMSGHHALFVGGHSAGAFNAAMLATDERFLAAVGVPAGAIAGYILLSGPYNMAGPLPTPLSAIFPGVMRDRADANVYIDGSEPPLLLMTADADDVVSPYLTRQLADTVKARGGRVTVTTISDSSDHLETYLELSEPGSAGRQALAAFIATTVGD